MVQVIFQEDAADFIDLDKAVNELSHRYCLERPLINEK